MKTAIIGSRSLNVDIDLFIPGKTTEIISGGAKGIDLLAERYADNHNIKKTIIKPDYRRYGKAAPLRRNDLIVDQCDVLVAVWDGKSKGTIYTVKKAKEESKRVILFELNDQREIVNIFTYN